MQGPVSGRRRNRLKKALYCYGTSKVVCTMNPTDTQNQGQRTQYAYPRGSTKESASTAEKQGMPHQSAMDGAQVESVPPRKATAGHSPRASGGNLRIRHEVPSRGSG